MTKLQKRIITALTTGSLLLQSALPALAATTTLSITGNGSDSESNVTVAQSNTNTVVQSNVTAVNNNINVDTNTGGNTADDNTGGNVHVETGDSDVEVNVMNQLNNNVAEVEACDCDSDTLVKIVGNGTGTENDIVLGTQSSTQLFQTNVAHVNNDVDVDAKTGDNSAEDNTGGDVVIVSGDVDVAINAATMANTNSARISSGNGNGGSVELLIEGNGSDSDNDIELALLRGNTVRQDNLTSIRNDFDVDAYTGNNDADDNTGGNVGIGTGDITMEVNVLNEAGFNAADVDCDCLYDEVSGTVSSNGTDSENDLEAVLSSESELYQSNLCGYGEMDYEPSLFSKSVYPYPTPCFDNDLDLNGQTGDNGADDNTGDVDSDPLILTGDSDAVVNVNNVGGSNVVGEVGGWDMPEMESDFDFSFSFDMSDLLAWLAAQS